MSRRASAFASASEAALRLPEAFDELYMANPTAAMTTMMRTSKTPFMASSVPTGKNRSGAANQP
jgi:phenylalanyl-tRNA synthetase beta subunit